MGVAPNAERTDVRRAYSRLIRRFRPESHPHHFQQLHEAYEVALAIVDGRGQNMLSSNANGPPFDFQGEHTASTPNTPDGNTDAVESDAEQLWKTFVDVPGVEPFVAMQRLAKQPQTQGDVFLMLYWMQRLHPQVSDFEDRTKWLVQGQERRSQDVRFLQLYMTELRADSSLCIDPSTEKFVELITNSDARVDYLTVRWDGIGRRGKWTRLGSEIEFARGLFGIDRTEQWVRLLLAAYEIVSFSTDSAGDQLLRKIHEEIISFPDLELSLNQELESLDLWKTLRSQRSRVGTDEIFQFVTQYHHSNPAETRLAVISFLRRWVNRPRAALNVLTASSANQPEAFWQFCHYVSVAESTAEDLQDDTISRAIIEFLPETYADSYAGMRYRILEFCRAECLGPQQFFQNLGTVATEIGIEEELFNALRDDHPLYVAIKCMHLFLTAAGGEFTSTGVDWT